MLSEASVQSPERRRGFRRPVELRAFAVQDCGQAAEARIDDLSYDGCNLACEDVPVTEGDELELQVVRLGIIKAEVRWAGNGRAGCAFVD
jgi:hypothetical protein